MGVGTDQSCSKVEIIENWELTFFRHDWFPICIHECVYYKHISSKVHLNCIPFWACRVMLLGIECYITSSGFKRDHSLKKYKHWHWPATLNTTNWFHLHCRQSHSNLRASYRLLSLWRLPALNRLNRACLSRHLLSMSLSHTLYFMCVGAVTHAWPQLWPFSTWRAKVTMLYISSTV